MKSILPFPSGRLLVRALEEQRESGRESGRVVEWSRTLERLAPIGIELGRRERVADDFSGVPATGKA